MLCIYRCCCVRVNFLFFVIFLVFTDLFLKYSTINFTKMPHIEVSIYEILQYIGNRSRPLQEGEAVFKAGHVILCGISGGNPDIIKSLCLQTSGLTSPPHEISIEINKDVTKWRCACYCKAGLSGFCKHIVATLIYVNRNEQLEVVSSTDLAQKWGKEKKGLEETHKPEPFKYFCHPLAKRKKVCFKTSTGLDEENFALLTTGVADSALSRFLGRVSETRMTALAVPQKRDSTLTSGVKAVLSHIEKSEFLNELKLTVIVELYPLEACCLQILQSLSASNISEIALYEQGSTEWMKERQLRITGSTCYSIFTFSKEEEWVSKAKKFFFPKGFENKFVKYGKKYEKEALAIFEEKTNYQIVAPGFIVSKAFPWLGYSPDGIILENDVPSKLIEIKCPYVGKEKGPESFVESCDYLEGTNSDIRLKKKTHLLRPSAIRNGALRFEYDHSDNLFQPFEDLPGS